MNYAFLNQDSIVVNIITGTLTDKQLAQFLGDYEKLFGATQVVAVGDGQPAWIGGAYTGGEFLPPPVPEPAPEPLPEPLPEPQPEPEI